MSGAAIPTFEEFSKAGAPTPPAGKIPSFDDFSKEHDKSATQKSLEHEGFVDSLLGSLKAPFMAIQGYAHSTAADPQFKKDFAAATGDGKTQMAKDYLLQHLPFASTIYKATHGNMSGAAGDIVGGLPYAALAESGGRGSAGVRGAGAGEVAEQVATATGGAATGAAKAAIEPVKYGHLKLPVPAPIAGAAAGGYAGAQLGVPHAVGAAVGAAVPLVKGAIKGAKAALADRVAAAAQAASEERATPAAAAVPPARQLGTGDIQMPPAPDGSYVRAVPAEYPPVEQPPQQVIPEGRRLAAPAQGAIVTPPPPDASFVRAVPAEYPTVEGAAPIPAPAAPVATLDEVAQGQGFKSFEKAPPPAQDIIRGLTAKLNNPPPGPPPSAPPVAPTSQPVAPPEQSAPARLSVQQQMEALRDEMVRSGTYTPEAAEPAAAPSAPSTANLRDLMRDMPGGTGKAIAKANYRADQEPATAAATYEAGQRADKAVKLAEALSKGGIGADDAARMTKGHWEQLAKGLGIHPPSLDTTGEVLFRLQRLEAAAKAAGAGK